MQRRFGGGSAAFYGDGGGGGGGVDGQGGDGVDRSLRGVIQIVIGNPSVSETKMTGRRSALPLRGHGWDRRGSGCGLGSSCEVLF